MSRRSKESVWDADKPEVFTAEIENKDGIFSALEQAAVAPKKSSSKTDPSSTWEVTKEEKDNQVWKATTPSKEEIFQADKEVIWDKKVLDLIMPLPIHEFVIDGVRRLLYWQIPDDLKTYRNLAEGAIHREWASSVQDLSSSGKYISRLDVRGEPFNWHYENPVIRLFNTLAFPAGDVDFAVKLVKKFYPDVVFYMYPSADGIKRSEFAQTEHDGAEGQIRTGYCTTLIFSKEKYCIDHLIANLLTWTVSQVNRNKLNEGDRARVWSNPQEVVEDPFHPKPSPPLEPIKEPKQEEPIPTPIKAKAKSPRRTRTVKAKV